MGAEKKMTSSSSTTEHNNQYEAASNNNKEREEFSSVGEEMMFAKRGGCCFFWLPCLEDDQQRSSETVGLSVWERIRTAEKEDKWWMKGWKAVKKVREWSEIMAGPKWKTFIRRFNINNNNNNKNGGGGGGGGGGGKSGKYQYDPLSYALNFDEGTGGQDSLLDDDDFAYRDFSSRYAAIPISAKTSMDLGKDGPNFI